MIMHASGADVVMCTWPNIGDVVTETNSFKCHTSYIKIDEKAQCEKCILSKWSDTIGNFYKRPKIKVSIIGSTYEYCRHTVC